MKRLYNTLTQQFLPSWPRRDDDGEIVGLDPSLQVYNVIQIPQPEVGANEYLTRTEVPDHEAKTLTLGWQVHVLPDQTHTREVTFRALAFTLLDAGLYEQVKSAALSTLEGEIWWNTAQSTTVQRDHPVVTAIAAIIGQTSEQLDAIFAAAEASQF